MMPLTGYRRPNGNLNEPEINKRGRWSRMNTTATIEPIRPSGRHFLWFFVWVAVFVGSFAFCSTSGRVFYLEVKKPSPDLGLYTLFLNPNSIGIEYTENRVTFRKVGVYSSAFRRDKSEKWYGSFKFFRSPVFFIFAIPIWVIFLLFATVLWIFRTPRILFRWTTRIPS